MAEAKLTAEAANISLRNEKEKIELQFYKAEKRRAIQNDKQSKILETIKDLSKCCATWQDRYTGNLIIPSLSKETREVIEDKILELVARIK